MTDRYGSHIKNVIIRILLEPNLSMMNYLWTDTTSTTDKNSYLRFKICDSRNNLIITKY